MQNRLIQLLTRSDMDEIEKITAMPTLRLLVMISILGSGGVFALALFGGFARDLRIPTAIMLAITIACYFLLQRGVLLPSQVLLPTALFLGITYIAANAYGLHDESIIAYAFVIIMAQLTLGQRAVFIFSGLIIVTVFAMGIAEITGILVSPTSSLTLPASPLVIAIVVIATAFAQRAISNLLNQSVRRSRDNEQRQKDANAALQVLQQNLEKRVADRTMDLAEANRHNERRAIQFRAITLVSQATASVQDLNALLPRIVEHVSQQFGFYHVGIFLNDASNEYAVFSAANSPGGRRMLERGHRLKIGEQGIVGFVTRTGEPRIALDVGKDSAHFKNPDLPETRSEMALPMKISGTLIGALDIQSTEPNAFSDEDVEVLSTLANQIGLAIHNARLYDQTQRSLTEAEAVDRQYLRDTWRRLPQEQRFTGFRYAAGAATPLENTATADHPDRGNQRTIDSHAERQEVSVPISLRGETIGTLVVQVPQHQQIKGDQMDLIKAVAERVALSAENARLFEETTRRAEREKLVSDITTKIRGSNDAQEMIQTAVSELQRALGATRVEIVPQKSTLSPDK